MRAAMSFALLLVAALATSGCAAAVVTPAAPVHAEPTDVDARLGRVAEIHGGAGPWAVAGLRMGEFALRSLGLPRGSFDLEVTHYSPREVQYSCIADGAAAATGASMGKLNLSLATATAAETHTLYKRRSTGQTLDLRFTKAFATRYLDVPLPRLGEAGREVMALPDEDIFEVVRP